ncbi:MAG: SIMPL domain-containing protein [Anaerolineales bacterium]|nr:SIMPL domain-containing protein [Anaerolineales bacterium]
MRSKFFLFTSILVLALALTACGGSSAPTDQASPRTLNISGTGTVYLTPDIAYIYIGVHTEDPDIASAVDQNNAQAQAVVDALQATGIEASDIQTSNFSVWGSQQYDPQTGQYYGMIYMVDNTVYVTVRDLSQLPEILDAAIAAGANNINSIQFDVADKSQALIEARQLAMQNAAGLADELAANANVDLGEIMTISYNDYVPMPYYGYGMGGGGGTEGVSTPINPGQMQITATVSVVYEIK